MNSDIQTSLNSIKLLELEIAFLIQKNRIFRKAHDCQSVETNNLRLKEIHEQLSIISSVIRRKSFQLVLSQAI